jgi:hypothetical protein
MAYGALIYNNSGEVLINDAHPTMVLHRSGQLDSGFSNYAADAYGHYYSECGSPWKNAADYYLSAGDNSVAYNPNSQSPADTPNPNPWMAGVVGKCTVYGDTPSSEFLLANGRMIFVNLAVGHSFTYVNFLGSKSEAPFYGIKHTQPIMQYAIAGPRDAYANPTGYGMAIYNSAGKCLWDAETAIGYIAAGRQELTYSQTFNHPADAQWVSIPPQAYAWKVPNSNDRVLTHIKRNSTSQVQMVSYRTFTGTGAGPENAATSLLVGKF